LVLKILEIMTCFRFPEILFSQKGICEKAMFCFEVSQPNKSIHLGNLPFMWQGKIF
jgi:hypothetical protein